MTKIYCRISFLFKRSKKRQQASITIVIAKERGKGQLVVVHAINANNTAWMATAGAFSATKR